ncbi:MAG: dTDP-4-dehydrorhamnose reductase [Alteromonadaceae bacterium]|nr:MAG: dTDP-4-dehydrorhamnose reductase [Alteromonadaceae bacterium]
MKILVTGANGQLAWELKQTQASEHEVVYLSRSDLDISQSDQVQACLDKYSPDALINTAAYTAVDRAETDSDTAYAVNRDGVKNLAQACQGHNCYLLHISTDFVFDGKANTPLTTTANIDPVSIYGKSKAEGEQALAEHMTGQWAIIRTAWVYSSHGANFVKTMLKLMADKPTLGIIADQIGSPTWANGLALACWEALNNRSEGLFHWTDAGVASWYDFAVAIQDIAIEKGLLEKHIPIKPITTVDYPTPAARPPYSVLDKSAILSAHPNLEQQHWRTQLTHMLEAVKRNTTDS